MQRQYKIGDIITIRGRKYEVRPRSDFGPFEYCGHCAFIDKKLVKCKLRKFYRHFLNDCTDKSVYFKRV